MMVDIFVYIECTECIIQDVWLNVPGDAASDIYWNEMGCMVNGIDMNNGKIGRMVMEVTWLNNPHPSVLIWQIIHFVEPANNSTGVMDSTYVSE